MTTARIVDISGYARRKRDEMSAISDIREKEFSTWTPEQNCFVEIWETNGLEDLAEKAATNYAAMQARIEKLEAGIRRIVNGEYDNARTIDAAEKFARELLRGDE